MRIKVLIVAFSDSIHTARWISQLDNKKYEVHLFPSVPFRKIHPLIENITIWQWPGGNTAKGKPLEFRNPSGIYRILESVLGSVLTRKIAVRYKSWLNFSLQETVRVFQPDVIHSMETQKAGYLVCNVKHLPDNLKWIHSTWGIDLHYFQSFSEHKKKIEKLVSRIDMLISEGERDVQIARKFGYSGTSVIIPSVGGGMDFGLIDQISQSTPPSLRKLIILKGYDGQERSAGIALRALRLIPEMLKDYEVIIYSCSKSLEPMVKEIRLKREFNLGTLAEVDYREMLEIIACSRISITNNLSDGVPNTMLEAMAFGTFPIQSNTAITSGWIEDGKNGLLTEPTNADQIAAAISKAIADDRLVDSAADINRKLVREKLNPEMIRKQIGEIYNL